TGCSRSGTRSLRPPQIQPQTRQSSSLPSHKSTPNLRQTQPGISSVQDVAIKLGFPSKESAKSAASPGESMLHHLASSISSRPSSGTREKMFIEKSCTKAAGVGNSVRSLDLRSEDWLLPIVSFSNFPEETPDPLCF